MDAFIEGTTDALTFGHKGRPKDVPLGAVRRAAWLDMDDYRGRRSTSSAVGITEIRVPSPKTWRAFEACGSVNKEEWQRSKMMQHAAPGLQQ